MNARFGVAGKMLPLILMAGLIAGCGQGGRRAAEATTDAIPAAGSPSAESSSVGLIVLGSRICINNKSNTTSVDPGSVNCQAGYAENGADTDLRAISGPTRLNIFARNSAVASSYAGVKFIDDRGRLERWVIESESGVGVHEKANTPDGRFALDLYRVDDRNGWKQWRLEVFDQPTE